MFYTLRPGPNGGNEYTIHERLSRDDDEVRREGEVCFRESQEVTACQCPLFVAACASLAAVVNVVRGCECVTAAARGVCGERSGG